MSDLRKAKEDFQTHLVAGRVARRKMSEEDFNEFNTALAKLMRGLKRDVGAKIIRQGYRGTGSQKARRQIFVRWPDGTPLDIWLDKGSVQMGGIHNQTPPSPATFPAERTPEATYKKMVGILKAWRSGS